MGRSSDEDRIDDEDRRAIVVLGLVMVLLTTLGYVALGIIMKFNGYPNQNPFIRFTPLAVTLRQHGPWSLLVLLLWAISVFISHYNLRRRIFQALTGFLSFLGLLVPCLFFYAALNSYTHSLLIKTSPTNTAPPSADRGASSESSAAMIPQRG